MDLNTDQLASYHALSPESSKFLIKTVNLLRKILRQRLLLGLLVALLCSGCYLSSLEGDIPASVEHPTATVAILMAQDESYVMRGICFEAAQDAAGQVFVLRNAEDHIHFYDLADNSHLCRRPVERVPFDFSTGRILVGLWSKGTGCTARHEVESMSRDDTARTITIRARFIVEGDCPYELVRPFWRSLDGVSDYKIDLEVTQGP